MNFFKLSFPSMPGLFHRLLRLSGLNWPLGLGIGVRVWAVIAGLVSVRFIVGHLSPVLQGYYYAFGSLTQLTQLVDLGLQILVQQFASHEAAHLSFGRQGTIVGPEKSISRLVSVGRFSLAWFAVLGAVAIGILVVAGQILFAHKAAGVEWQGAWLVLCCLLAVDLWLSNFVWLLEGTNQLVISYIYRLGRGILVPMTLWLGLAHGFALYAVPASLATGLVFLALYLLILRREFALTFLKHRPSEHSISWRHEILPLQLRLSISTLASLVTYDLMVPFAFRFAGPIPAGQFGLSWTLVEAATGVALLWPTLKFPAMGALAALHDWKGLDRTALIVGAQAVALITLGALTIIAGGPLVGTLYPHLRQRILPELPLAILAGTAIVKVILSSIVFYLRAHRKEPMAALTAISAPVTLGAIAAGAVWKGTLGITTAYAAVMLLVMLPGTILILLRARATWHRGP